MCKNVRVRVRAHVNSCKCLIFQHSTEINSFGYTFFFRATRKTNWLIIFNSNLKLHTHIHRRSINIQFGIYPCSNTNLWWWLFAFFLFSAVRLKVWIGVKYCISTIIRIYNLLISCRWSIFYFLQSLDPLACVSQLHTCCCLKLALSNLIIWQSSR